MYLDRLMQLVEIPALILMTIGVLLIWAVVIVIVTWAFYYAIIRPIKTLMKGK